MIPAPGLVWELSRQERKEARSTGRGRPSAQRWGCQRCLDRHETSHAADGQAFWSPVSAQPLTLEQKLSEGKNPLVWFVTIMSAQ